MTYDELIALIPETLMAQNRTLVSALVLQNIIRRAEDEIIQRIDHEAFRTVINPAFTIGPGNPTIDLSTQTNPVLEIRAVRRLDNGIPVPMERREVERMNLVYAQGDTGEPRFYAEDDSALLIRLYPYPDTAYQVQVTANVTPARLSPVIQQSVLTRRFPRLLEHMALKHGAHFMRNPNDEQRYGNIAENALAEVNMQMMRRRRDETNAVATDTANVAG